jgi:hypothetical protein
MINIFNTQTFELEDTIECGNHISKMTFSPKGDVLAAGNLWGKVYIYKRTADDGEWNMIHFIAAYTLDDCHWRQRNDDDGLKFKVTELSFFETPLSELVLVTGSYNKFINQLM